MKHFAALLMLASPAAAQNTPAQFSLPAGCDAFLTVQSNSCQVDHHFTCQSDAEGLQRRVGLDETGLVYAGQTDYETQWITSFHPMTGHTETLESSPVEPASLSELLNTGVDKYDFQTLSDEIGTTRYVGQDTLTGRQVEIDGVTLSETSYEIVAYNAAGDEVWRSSGNEYVSPDWRVFLSGTGVTTVGSESFEKDDSPVEFIYPGEPGFLSVNPKHGCGVAIS